MPEPVLSDLPAEAERIIKRHVLWAMGGGLIPVPVLDIAAVTGIQLDMMKQLAALFEADYSRSTGKMFVSALTGSTFAALGASLVKAIPGIGTVLGGASMSVMSGASTYAVGRVAVAQFATRGSLAGADLEQARRAYKEAFRQGEAYVAGLEREENTKDTAADTYEALKKLGELRDSGVLTEEEFEAKKKELLDRL